jgi:hypothetical protein
MQMTQFPRSVTLDSNFIHSKKVSKLKYIFRSKVWVELNIYFKYLYPFPCRHAALVYGTVTIRTLKTWVPSSLKAWIISAFSMLFDTCGSCDGSIICQKRSGIACLKIYNLDLFLNREMLWDPIRLELKRKILDFKLLPCSVCSMFSSG